MPNSKDIFSEIKQEHDYATSLDAFGQVRKKYLLNITKQTKRNCIAYYSGWLQQPGNGDFGINDKDKNGFMLTVQKLDRKKGLDLILHTPGGDLAATESLIDYLHTLFSGNIRAIIPQICMSGGTIIALSCLSILMGNHSNLGPIDPQFDGIACQAVLDEFDLAKADIAQNPDLKHLWEPIIRQYPPSFIIECEKAVAWAEEIALEWLQKNMCKNEVDKAQSIKEAFSDHKITKSHNRHISKQKCKDIGVKIIDLEENQKLQDAVLSVHHAYMHTLYYNPIIKIIENQFGIAYIESIDVKDLD